MMINSYAVPARPATSPVPNLSNAARCAAKGGPRCSAMSSIQAAALHQAAVRLRPLPPPGGRQPPTSSGAAVGTLCCMVIEGKTTGEEIERNAIDIRTEQHPSAAGHRSNTSTHPPQSSAPPQPAGRAPSRAGEGEEAERLRHRLKRTENELKKSQEQCKRRSSEVSDALARISEVSTELQTQKEAAHLARQEAAAARASRAEDAAQAAAETSRLRKELEEMSKRLKSQDQSHESAVAAAASKHESDARAWSAERSKLENAISEAQQDAANQRRRADLLQSTIDGLRDAASATTKKSEEDRAARMKSDSAYQQLIDELRAEAERARAALAEWKERIQRCDSFVLDICQPHFTVVKDEALSPMDVSADHNGQQGFVLVPLALLLRGYGLLPSEQKKSIADRYEKSKRA